MTHTMRRSDGPVPPSVRRLGWARAGIATLLVASPVVATSALAVSVANRDDKEYKLTIVEGDAKSDKVLKPMGSLEGLCLKGCVIRLGDSENDEYELEGTEVVSIEDGYLYYDGPDGGAEAVPGGQTAQPPSPQSPPTGSPK